MYHKDHVTSVISDYVMWMCAGIIKELVDFGHCMLGGVSLLVGDGASGQEHSCNDHPSVVYKSYCNLLFNFSVGFVQWMTCVGVRNILYFCAIYRLICGYGWS